jgi:hypothetical protein
MFRIDSSWMGEDDWMNKQANGRPLVLLLEDEALIVLNLQDDLQDAGYEVAGPFTTCAAALEWLQTERLCRNSFFPSVGLWPASAGEGDARCSRAGNSINP